MTVTPLWLLVRRIDYRRARDQGLISVKKHPELDLWIHNYTAAAQYTKGAFDNPAVRLCRGIITNEKDEIVAQPFPKFFNYGQPEAGDLERYMNSPAWVLDKLDGSLGILYPTGSLATSAGIMFPENAIATRGSFASEQAIRGTKIWKEKYAPFWTPDKQVTYLFEIIYPENRIVVDYGDMEDLVLLGSHHTGTRQFTFSPAHSAPGAQWWPGPKAETLKARSLHEALEMSPRENAEGVVVVIDKMKMVKIKQADYLALHRLVTGLRPRAIWEFLAVNACKEYIKKPKDWAQYLRLDPARAEEILEVGPDWKKQYLEGVPDEFYGWVDENVRNIQESVDLLEAELTQVAESLWHLSRKNYFKEIKEHEHFGILGLMYDGRDATTQLWLAVYPDAGNAFKEQSEDEA